MTENELVNLFKEVALPYKKSLGITIDVKLVMFSIKCRFTKEYLGHVYTYIVTWPIKDLILSKVRTYIIKGIMKTGTNAIISKIKEDNIVIM